MATILIRKKEKVDVPESDIQEIIAVVKDWFDRHPERDDCTAAMFGYPNPTIRRGFIEQDIREVAEHALPYEKV